VKVYIGEDRVQTWHGVWAGGRSALRVGVARTVSYAMLGLESMLYSYATAILYSELLALSRPVRGESYSTSVQRSLKSVKSLTAGICGCLCLAPLGADELLYGGLQGVGAILSGKHVAFLVKTSLESARSENLDCGSPLPFLPHHPCQSRMLLRELRLSSPASCGSNAPLHCTANPRLPPPTPP
jgi:hypothetical protein